MFTRKRTNPESNSDEASPGSLRLAIADAAWSLRERLESPLDRSVFALQRGVIWPLADRAESAGRQTRMVGFGVVLLVAAAVGVGALVWVAPDRPASQASTATVVKISEPAAEAAASAPATPEPTLHGAKPDFDTALGAAHSVKADSAKSVDAKSSAKSSASSTSAPSPQASSSSQETASASSSSSAQSSAVAGAPAGPAAISVARSFAAAFVLYETGSSGSDVREAFAESATPPLSRSLMRRPPRLPADVTVPKAKVLNVVAAPSHGRVYPVSVSLLRVGVTSELRLEMEKLKSGRWLVTNVLG
jgi:hypothetical protein